MDSMVVGVGIKTRYLLKAVEARRVSFASSDIAVVALRRPTRDAVRLVLVARARSFSRDSSARSERRYIQGMPRGKHVCKFHKTVPNKYSSLAFAD